MRSAHLARRIAKPVPFDEAVTRLCTLSTPLDIERVPLAEARNRILAADAVALCDVPPFSRAMMDGYAIRSTDIHGPHSQLRVIDARAAGDGTPLVVGPGQAIRIATGAPMPDGADSVVRFEWVEPMGSQEIRVNHPVLPGESVQPAGEDGQRGEVVLARGTRLDAGRLSLCKSFGMSEVSVAKSARVSILVTGNELVAEAGKPLGAGQIYASTDIYLTAALVADGCTVGSVQYVPDDAGVIADAVRSVTASSDFLLITGGVSVGDFDHVPHALRSLGCQCSFERLMMRPGAPLVATRLLDTTILAMSGNPAACIIQFELFARLAIRQAMGWGGTPFPESGKLAYSVSLKQGRLTRVLRAKAWIQDGIVRVDPRCAQSAGVISSLADANCLIRLDETDVEQGQIVPLRFLS